MTTSMIAWYCMTRTPTTTSTDTHMGVARIVSSVAQCHIICTHTHTPWLKMFESFHVISTVHVHASGSPRLDSPFLFPALPHVPNLLPPDSEVRGEPAHSAKREYGLHRRVLSSPQVMSPKPTTSTRPQSSPTCSSWTRRRSSPTKSLLRDDATLEDMLHQTHRTLPEC